MPETVVDPVFGRLEWDDGFLAWKGEIAWSPNHRIEILLGEEGRASNFREARASLEWLRSHEARVRELVAKDLLDWCNDEFSPESRLGEIEFLRGVEFHQLRLEGNGAMWVLYYDGHLFGGHVFWAEFGPDRAFLGTSVD